MNKWQKEIFPYVQKITRVKETAALSGRIFVQSGASKAVTNAADGTFKRTNHEVFN